MKPTQTPETCLLLGVLFLSANLFTRKGSSRLARREIIPPLEQRYLPRPPGELHAWLDFHCLHKQTRCVELSRKANMADIQNDLASQSAAVPFTQLTVGKEQLLLWLKS